MAYKLRITVLDLRFCEVVYGLVHSCRKIRVRLVLLASPPSQQFFSVRPYLTLKIFCVKIYSQRCIQNANCISNKAIFYKLRIFRAVYCIYTLFPCVVSTGIFYMSFWQVYFKCHFGRANVFICHVEQVSIANASKHLDVSCNLLVWKGVSCTDDKNRNHIAHVYIQSRYTLTKCAMWYDAYHWKKLLVIKKEFVILMKDSNHWGRSGRSVRSHLRFKG